MAKAKAVENSDAANDLINTAGVKSDTNQASSETPGTTDGTTGPSPTNAAGPDAAGTGGPTPEQTESAAPYQGSGEIQKEPLSAADQLNLDLFTQEMNKDTPAPPLTDEQVATIAAGLKGETTENLVKMQSLLNSELGAREVPGPAPHQFQGINEPTTADEQQHLKKVAQFGEGYVDAENVDGRQTTFTATAWGNLPATKDGWKQIVKTPPEVAALNK